MKIIAIIVGTVLQSNCGATQKSKQETSGLIENVDSFQAYESYGPYEKVYPNDSTNYHYDPDSIATTPPPADADSIKLKQKLV